MASSHTCCHGQRQLPCCSKTPTASIQMVRCAGNPQPENTAYKVASSKPPQAPARCAGSHKHQAGVQRAEPRHKARSKAAASQANKVMCKPEMLMRWATPVARNTSQSLRSMAAWSPITSATTTPAMGPCTWA